jgi:tetratricopeptide (TPR) repeat protein
MNHEVLFETCEAFVRNGQVADATLELKRLEPSRVPRSYKLRFANLCRRVGLANTGLNLLRELVRPNLRTKSFKPSAAEAAEYAILLDRVGANREALLLLKDYSDVRTPEIRFAQAACSVSAWNYEDAAPLFQDYCVLATTDYAKCIGRVNFAAALVATGRFDEAKTQLAIALSAASANGWKRLEANCYEIRAQLLIHTGALEEAEADLSRSMEVLGLASTREPVHIKKWQAVIKAQREHDVSYLREIRSLALAMKDYFTVREADLYSLKVCFEPKLFDRLYFGSSQPGYRRHVEQVTNHAASASKVTFGETAGMAIDFTTARILRSTSSREEAQPCENLKSNSKTYLLLKTLFSDFYSPFSIGSLFSHLFASDFYDPLTSPERVRQVIYRTRKLILQLRLPIKIVEEGGFYRVQTDEGLATILEVEGLRKDGREALIERLLRRQMLEFTAREAREHLGLSYGSWHRFITWATESGRVQVAEVRTNATYHYRICA